MKIRIILLVLLIGCSPIKAADAWVEMNGGYNPRSREGWGEVMADGVVFVWKGVEHFYQGIGKLFCACLGL